MVDSLLGKLFYTKPNLSSYDVRNFHGALPNESGLSSVVRLCTNLSTCTYPYKRDCLNYQLDPVTGLSPASIRFADECLVDFGIIRVKLVRLIGFEPIRL